MQMTLGPYWAARARPNGALTTARLSLTML